LSAIFKVLALIQITIAKSIWKLAAKLPVQIALEF